MPFSLQVIPDPDQAETYRWVILEQEPDDAYIFKPYSAADCDFMNWPDALNAGTVALAKAEGKAYENEAADPVSDDDCS